jgi:hypothetical protein
MKEACCQFGPQRQLTGITTEPIAATRRLATVLVSAGLVPKFGPYRLYAQLARRLALDDVRTLRFDLGDIGDSRQVNSGRTLEERTKLEIGAALDHLGERHDFDGIVLGGLCSGAEDSFRYAELDRRVTGVVLIDPFSYRTAGWHWRHHLHRLARRAMRALGLYEPLDDSAMDLSAGANTDASRLSYKGMGIAEASRILITLIARGVHIHFVYTGGMRASFNHPGQLEAMFSGIDFRGLVTLDYFPQFEHTQAFQNERHLLVEAISRHLDSAHRPVAASALAPASLALAGATPRS